MTQITQIDPKARADEMRATHEQFVAEFRQLWEASKAAPDSKSRLLLSALAEIASCRARRAKQWADAYELVAVESDGE